LIKKLSAIIIALVFIVTAYSASLADAVSELTEYKPTQAELSAYDRMWQYSTDEDRYYMDSAVKARAVGLSLKEFKFFARVVEGEGKFCETDITDKVLIACVVINRTNCSRWPTWTISKTLRRENQFLAVNQETHECYFSRTLDSEWAVVLAYRLIDSYSIDCHMVYYNSTGFGGYSSCYADYINCSYCGGNYFSCIDCDCEHCSNYCRIYDPEWSMDAVEMISPRYERPIGRIEKADIVYLGRN
jgi:hypothetical protein